MDKFILAFFLLIGAGQMSFAQNDSQEAKADGPKLEAATFAGGCFWCMQPPYDKLKGVISTTVGFTGGQKENPTYEEVSSGTTGHCEAVEIVFNPQIVSYAQLLDLFWYSIDPTTPQGQFNDIGPQYRTAIFYHTPEQKRLALASKETLEKSGRYRKPITTEIAAASKFYPAEEYHQQYYRKNPLLYNAYRANSGRDQYLKKIWGKDYHH